ncbi:universal stress protein [Streptomyces hygroscopicus subsp. hygroscopicus]|uniref:Universal stress protein n=1 Tax=Streptomyces hygroscopicus TaxID=1912 RepID=A0ABQ3UF94_STRHY|nr:MULTISPECIES: universal stress protein [Streptomyces]MBW8093369.1 universal stress protein [Streptomyces hygroscopicus subsp. hygroscopicus]MDN3059507.1 universal stress protein [Streptomyces sp. SRF1]GHJ33833.1 universal stress protein [Streptomyces hygroscopicus]
MNLPLVVGVDGSDSSLRAVDWAVAEAALHTLPLRLIYAARWERYEEGLASYPGCPSGAVVAEHIVASCVERARRVSPAVRISGEVLSDGPVSALLQEGHGAFALVTGSRGWSELAETLLGSVSLAVAARAVCPVIVVRGPEQDRHGAGRPVVVGVGHLGQDAAAVRFAYREARARGVELHAVRAWRRPAHARTDQPLLEAAHLLYEEQAATVLDEVLGQVPCDDGQPVCRREVVEGPAHRVLLAASAAAGLLVVGALRPPGDFGLQLGRVSHAVLHHADCPVAVVPRRV